MCEYCGSRFLSAAALGAERGINRRQALDVLAAGALATLGASLAASVRRRTPLMMRWCASDICPSLMRLRSLSLMEWDSSKTKVWLQSAQL